nr:MAG: AAA family ATPase [Bacillota bacterium]
MKKGSVRRFYPGGNTPRGYISFFDSVLPWDNAKKFFIMKGGPGVGKSTFIKKIGEKLVRSGVDVEFLHCSADRKSLDGLILPKYGIALIDGTAPHVVDPKYPGCVEEIINFGDSWNEAGIIKHKSEIIKLQKEISRGYKKGYGYLRAAKALYDEIQEIYSWAVDEKRLNAIIEEVVGDIFTNAPGSGRVPKERKMFATAIMAGGLTNLLYDNFKNVGKRYILKGESGRAKAKLIETVLKTAMIKGFEVETFYCPLSPETVEHVIIKDLNVGLINSVEPHVYKKIKSGDVSIDFDGLLDQALLEKHSKNVKFSKQIYEQLFNKAVECFNETKEVRDELESFYVKNMDFSKIEEKQENIYETLINLIGE